MLAGISVEKESMCFLMCRKNSNGLQISIDFLEKTDKDSKTRGNGGPDVI